MVPTPLTSAVVFRNIEADTHVALRCEMVDLVRLQRVEQLHQVYRIGQIAVMQEESHPIDMRISVKMIDPRSVEGAGAPDYPMDFVAFFEKKVGRGNFHPDP